MESDERKKAAAKSRRRKAHFQAEKAVCRLRTGKFGIFFVLGFGARMRSFGLDKRPEK
jgi:hypothetical protein